MKYTASRISDGNHLFPAEIIIENSGITVRIPGFFSNKSKYFDFNEIASIEVDTPLVGYSTLKIFAGGTNMNAHGFTVEQVKKIKRAVEDGKNKEKVPERKYEHKNTSNNDNFKNYIAGLAREQKELENKNEENISKCSENITKLFVILKSLEKQECNNEEFIHWSGKLENAKDLLKKILKIKYDYKWEKEYKNILESCRYDADERLKENQELIEDEAFQNYDNIVDSNIEEEEKLAIENIIEIFKNELSIKYVIPDIESFIRENEPKQASLLLADKDLHAVILNKTTEGKLFSVDYCKYESIQPIATIYIGEMRDLFSELTEMIIELVKISNKLNKIIKENKVQNDSQIEKIRPSSFFYRDEIKDSKKKINLNKEIDYANNILIQLQKKELHDINSKLIDVPNEVLPEIFKDIKLNIKKIALLFICAINDESLTKFEIDGNNLQKAIIIVQNVKEPSDVKKLILKILK